MCVAILADEIVGHWIGEGCPDEAEDESADGEGDRIGHDLLVDGGKTQVVPIESRGVRPAQEDCTGPVRGAEERDKGPGIVDGCTGKQGEKVEAKDERAKTDEDRMESVKRTEGDPDSDREGHRGPLR